jgi:hypothetical protein
MDSSQEESRRESGGCLAAILSIPDRTGFVPSPPLVAPVDQQSLASVNNHRNNLSGLNTKMRRAAYLATGASTYDPFVRPQGKGGRGHPSVANKPQQSESTSGFTRMYSKGERT